jgi:predicted dehydrogenase
MKYILPDKKILGVTATGISNYETDQENIAHLSLHFENNSCLAHFHVNWTSPLKIRRMIVAGNKKMLVFDDMENFEKIKVYDCGVKVDTKESIHKTLVQYRTGDMYSPKIIQTEALALGATEFINAINNNHQPLTSGKDGLDVVRILEASNESIKNLGLFVGLKNTLVEDEYKGNTVLIEN